MPDAVLERVASLVGRMHAGGRADARRGLAELWDEIGETGDPLLRCAVAHAAADTQDSAALSLHWNLRALAAGQEVCDARVHAAMMPHSARALLPSLYLNVAEDCLQLGHLRDARDHVDAGFEHLVELPDDGYREMLRAALQRISAKLDQLSAP